jgi:ribosomal protein S12 methylthiotransferase
MQTTFLLVPVELIAKILAFLIRRQKVPEVTRTYGEGTLPSLNGWSEEQPVRMIKSKDCMPSGSSSVLAPDSPKPAAPKVGFVSLGCPKNLVDSEVMMGLLSQSGAELVPRAEDADVIVVNTCSFIESAQQESVNTILEMARHKLGNAKKLVVAGCLVERFRDDIRKNIPEVDAVVGTGELESILQAAGVAAPPSATDSPFRILTSRAEGDARASQGRFSRETWDGAIADLPNYLYDDATPRILATARSTAYIKIAEGCDHPCGFCIIPQLRGKFRSRRFESVVAEAERLAHSGVREITLIGQDTTCYGEDFGLKDGLALLLEKLAGIEELRWVRFLYAYPNKITNRLLETIAANEKICSYLDVPLQHASAATLKRMKRGGSADIFLRTIEKARGTIPGLTLRTSFIVGFPGETETEFQELCEFVKAAEFDWMGSFAYSDQEGATAYALGDKLPLREIERRRKHLMHIQKQISKRKKKTLRGKEFDVLMEGASEESDLLLEGRTAMHAPEIDGKLYISDVPEGLDPIPGEFYRCQITETHDYDLVAKII